jgi:hypothetical protein
MSTEKESTKIVEEEAMNRTASSSAPKLLFHTYNRITIIA